MSMICGYEIDFCAYYSPVELLSTLFKYGWTFNLDGKICFLPLGKNDPFDAVVESVDGCDFVLDQIKKKSEIGELVMLSLVFNDTGIGGDFIFGKEDNSLNISLNINRRKISQSSSTDYDWYDARVIDPLLGAGYKAARIVAEDVGSDGETVYKRENYIPF